MLEGYTLEASLIYFGLVILVYLGYLLAKHFGKKKVQVVLWDLIIRAEQYIGSGKGELKKQQVITWLMLKYPLLSKLVSVEQVSELIDMIVASINKYLKSREPDIDVNKNSNETNIVNKNK